MSIKITNGMHIKFFHKNMCMFSGYVKGKSGDTVSTSQGKYKILEDGSWKDVSGGNIYHVYVLYK